MSTSNRRHTYYGGTTTITIPHPSGGNTHLNTHPVPSAEGKSSRRKYPSFGPYIIGSTLGEGEFGKVKLGWSKASLTNNGPHGSTDIPRQVAIKLIKRDTIAKDSNKEVKIYREINALKQLNHPNIVKLDEVLQNSKYIGIVLEYASGGEFYKYIQKKRRLKEPAACRLFAQLVSGVSYIHSKSLVHRDLKLENLLLDKNENLIITDFGFVNEFYSSNELMNTSCGSPCYAAPELVVSTRPYEARKADIWSCGVILFAMLAGYLPWDDDLENPDGNDIARLYRYITHTPLKFPEYINPLPRDLLRRILVPDPQKRVNTQFITEHKWLASHSSFLCITPDEWDKIALQKNVLRLPKHNSKQYNSTSNTNTANNGKNKFSKPRPLSTCSTASTNSNGEKRDSLLIDSTMLAFPAPPRESQSHVLTIPTLPSPERRSASGKHGHTRSNSAASLALQAVVEAERELLNQRLRASSITSNNNVAVKFETPASTSRRSTSSHSERNVIYNVTSPNFVGYSGVSNGDTSLMNKSNAIIESPVRGGEQTGGSDTTGGSSDFIMPPPSLEFNSGAGSLRSHSSSSSHFHSQFGVSAHRKPRPTSYHPGTFSTVPETTSDTLHFDTFYTPLSHITRSSSVVKDETPFSSPPKLQPSTSLSSKSPDISPKLYPRRSFSVKSKISLDIESVAGDLTKSAGNIDSTIKKLHEQVDEAPLSATDGGETALQPLDVNNSAISAAAVARRGQREHHPHRTDPNQKRFSLFGFYPGYHPESSEEAGKENIAMRRPLSHSPAKGGAIDSYNSGRAGYRNSVMISSVGEYHPSLPTMREHPDDREDASRGLHGSHRPSATRKVLNFFKTRSVRI